MKARFFIKAVMMSALLVNFFPHDANSAAYPNSGHFVQPGTLQIVYDLPADQTNLINGLISAANHYNQVLAGSGIALTVAPIPSGFKGYPQTYVNYAVVVYFEPTLSSYDTYDKDGILRRRWADAPIWLKGNFSGLNRLYRGFDIPLSQRYVQHSLIRVNPLVLWRQNPSPAHSIMLHEIGHILGMAHPNERGVSVSSVMNSGANTMYSPTMTAYDTSVVQYLYSTHLYQNILWDRLKQADGMPNNTAAQKRKRSERMAEVRQQLNSLMLSILN